MLLDEEDNHIFFIGNKSNFLVIESKQQSYFTARQYLTFERKLCVSVEKSTFFLILETLSRFFTPLFISILLPIGDVDDTQRVSASISREGCR